MKHDILIKAVHMPRYSVELYEVNTKYVIDVHQQDGKRIEMSSLFKDFNLISHIFDLTVERLEGN
jgi:hypothetical protein